MLNNFVHEVRPCIYKRQKNLPPITPNEAGVPLLFVDSVTSKVVTCGAEGLVDWGIEGTFFTFRCWGSWPGGYTGTILGGAKPPPDGTIGCISGHFRLLPVT